MRLLAARSHEETMDAGMPGHAWRLEAMYACHAINLLQGAVVAVGDGAVGAAILPVQALRRGRCHDR